MTVASTRGKQRSAALKWWITIETVRKVLQERALVILDLLSFLRHLVLVFKCTLNERGNPFLDDITVLLGFITERFEKRPESTPNASYEHNILNFHERIHEAIESIGTIR